MQIRAMTKNESDIWKLLERCVGRKHAVARSTLANMTGLNDRAMRQCIESLRKDHEKLICYATDRPGGYFIASSVAELKACRNLEMSREHRVRENRQFYDKALNAAGDDQMSMLLEE